MRQRVITAVIALAVLAPFLIFSQTFMLEILTTVLSTLAVYEVLHCMGYDRNPVIAVPAYLFAIITSAIVRQISDASTYISIMYIAGFILMFYMMTVSVFSKKKFAINDAGLIYVMTQYIVFGFACIALLRNKNHGEFLFLLVFLSAWMSDAGGYIVGRVIGKHKLCEDVSPKKTIEGALGGILFCVLSFCVYGFFVGKFFDVTPKYHLLILIAIVVSIISQCGDLIASLLKRHYNIKDYGYLLPGHGGVLDRFDSIIATAPFIYMLCSFSPFYEVFF